LLFAATKSAPMEIFGMASNVLFLPTHRSAPMAAGILTPEIASLSFPPYLLVTLESSGMEKYARVQIVSRSVHSVASGTQRIALQ